MRTTLNSREAAMAIQEMTDVTEQTRLNEAREMAIPWKKWDRT
jgi:hypothetical protein